MSILKIKYILSTMTAIMLLMTGSLSATHLVGGQLTYKCLGNNQYEVTLIVRRDCINGADDAPFDDPATVGIFDSFGFLVLSAGEDGRLELPLTNTRVIDTSLDKDCRLNPDDGLLCVEEAIYTGIITLPFNKNGYTLAYQRCCRNAILNNINDPLMTGVTYFSNITTQALLECNSQPVFDEFPGIYVCAGEKFTFTHTAIDPDGDELRYRFCIPSAGATIDNPNPQVPSTPPFPTVSWAPGFSTDNMFGPAGNITIDENTGMTMGTANLVGTYLIGICVDEFRNGVLISTTRRDFEYNVISCSPPIVIDCEIRGNDCDGDNTISFVNRSTGADSYMWYFDFPNTDPSTTSTIPSPTHTYPGPGKYTVRKEAIRDADGCSIFEEFIVSTGPSMLEPDFVAEFISCDGENLVGLTDLSADPTGISCAVAWNWTITLNGTQIVLDGNPATFDAGSATSAEITLEVTGSNGCVNTITRTINLSDLFPSSTIETTLLDCDNGFNLQLLNSSNSSFASVASTIWTITQAGTTTNPSGNPITINTQGGDISVTVSSTFSNGCESEQTIVLDESQYLPVIDIINTAGGSGSCNDSAIYTFSPRISGASVAAPITSYLWTDSNGNTYNTENINIELVPGETIGLELVVTYGNGCVFSSNDNNSIGRPFTFTAPIASDLTITPEVDCNSQGASTSVVLTDNTVNNSPITSQTWTINGVPQTAGSTLTFPVGTADVVITYNVTYANGCTASYSETFNRNTLIPTDQDAAAIISEVVSCSGNEITISISGGGNSANFAETWVVNGMTFNTSPVMITVGLNDQVDIQHTLTAALGCTSSAQESYIAESVIPAVVITNNLNPADCIDPAGQIITLSAGVNGSTYDWIIDGVAFSEANPQITVLPGQTVDASVDVVLPSGCNTSGSSTFTVSDNTGNGGPLTITSDLDGIDCINPNGQVITLATGIAGTAYAWIINGTQFSIPNPTITVLPGEVITASVEVSLPNGCVVIGNTTFTASNNAGGGPVTITNSRGTESPCIGSNGETLVLTADAMGQVASYEWNCTLDGIAIPTSNSPTVSVSIEPGQVLNCSVNVTYTNGCTATNNTQVRPQNSDQEVNVVETVDCNDPSTPNITLSYEQTIGGATPINFEWIVNGMSSNGPSVTFPLGPTTGGVSVSLTVLFDNGCTGTFSDIYDPSSLEPNLEYDATLLECMDGQALYEFMFNDEELLCISLETLVWTINGEMVTGNPVQIWLPVPAIIDVSVIATYSDGSIFGEGITLPPLNTEDAIMTTNIGVMQDDTGMAANCNGDIDLMVINPADSLNYEWTDVNGNPLGSGPTLTTNTGISGDTIMVNFSDFPNCQIGTGSIVIEDMSIVLAIDSTYFICPGDTSSINCITNANLDQAVTFNWKPADQLIDGADQSCPTIGIPEDQTDDFSLILCTTNNFGCERSDTIDFTISMPIDGAITFEPDSCGSFTYNFIAPDGVFAEGLVWNFGDGNTSFDLNPTHTYIEEGEFTVSLTTEGVCLGDVPPVTIPVPALPILDIEIDTVTYTFGDTAVVTAITNADPSTIVWCDANGDPIGMGNPLIYVPVDDPETVFAKVEDQFGCSNQADAVLMRTTSLPPILPPNVETACADEIFPITLDIGEADPADFNFDWQPADCVAAGQGTPVIEAASSGSKTFSVVVTNIETGQDTTITIDVNVEDLPVGIFADNGIPDQEGLPTVCQGSEITLSAAPFDDGCTYTWSTGENGPEIVVSPDVNTTYTLSCVSDNGCEFSASADVEVTPPQCNEDDVFVPNAFSPNADNINDRLFVRSKFIREMEFFVLDRWGEEVWRTTDQDQGWDGQFEGEALAPDSYAYCLIVTCVNDETYTTRGNVSILK